MRVQRKIGRGLPSSGTQSRVKSLPEHSIVTVYGGGAIGSMGRLAEGVLSKGGRIVGVIPRFMQELEWDHKGLSELQVVENMRERKHIMLTDSDAAIALPGGSGTLEELLEAISLKRLGIYLNPIVLVNVRGFFDPLLVPSSPVHRGAVYGRTPCRDVAGGGRPGRCSARHLLLSPMDPRRPPLCDHAAGQHVV